MVIDFNRLNSSSPLTGTTRPNASKETVETDKSAPAGQQRGVGTPQQ